MSLYGGVKKPKKKKHFGEHSFILRGSNGPVHAVSAAVWVLNPERYVCSCWVITLLDGADSFSDEFNGVRMYTKTE